MTILEKHSLDEEELKEAHETGIQKFTDNKEDVVLLFHKKKTYITSLKRRRYKTKCICDAQPEIIEIKTLGFEKDEYPYRYVFQVSHARYEHPVKITIHPINTSTKYRLNLQVFKSLPLVFAKFRGNDKDLDNFMKWQINLAKVIKN